MAKNEKPTAKQVAWLKKHGIIIPGTKKWAGSLISYVIKNNGAGPSEIGQRIAHLKSVQEQWLNKEALYNPGSSDTVFLPVTVVDMKARSEINVAISQHDGYCVGPFEFKIKFDDGKTPARFVGVSCLTKKEECLVSE